MKVTEKDIAMMSLEQLKKAARITPFNKDYWPFEEAINKRITKLSSGYCSCGKKKVTILEQDNRYDICPSCEG